MKNAPWLFVPQSEDMDLEGQVPDYSMNFSKTRKMKKQNKKDMLRASPENEELISLTTTRPTTTLNNHRNYTHDYSPNVQEYERDEYRMVDDYG